MNDILRIAACCVAAAALACPYSTTARAEPARLTRLSVEDLERAYLWCDAAAAKGRLRTADVAPCSVVYEDLKNVAFHGDFEKLLAWSRARQAERGLD